MSNWTSNRYTPVSVDGNWGPNTTRALQYGLGGLTVDGVFGTATKKRLQSFLGGLVVDGVFGVNTIHRLQARVGSPQDGVFAYEDNVALQKALNAGSLGTVPAPRPAPVPAPAPKGRVSILKSSVTFGRYAGGGNVQSWTTAALNALGLPVTNAWLGGYATLDRRESGDNPNAVNTSDSNANGPTVSDGHPLNCSRSVAQCIPGTFASYHASGTSNDIYDPVANTAASINYVRGRYNVRADGSNFAQQVQQADPSRAPRGY